MKQTQSKENHWMVIAGEWEKVLSVVEEDLCLTYHVIN